MNKAFNTVYADDESMTQIDTQRMTLGHKKVYTIHNNWMTIPKNMYMMISDESCSAKTKLHITMHVKYIAYIYYRKTNMDGYNNL